MRRWKTRSESANDRNFIFALLLPPAAAGPAADFGDGLADLFDEFAISAAAVVSATISGPFKDKKKEWRLAATGYFVVQ